MARVSLPVTPRGGQPDFSLTALEPSLTSSRMLTTAASLMNRPPLDRRTFFIALAWLSLTGAVPAADLAPGRTYFGEKNYIEYLPGDLPLVISAPHGGREKPDELPERTKGVVDIDTNTQELARTIADELQARTGRRPHLIICRLHRSRLDCNREIGEAAAGHAVAEQAWTEYHGFVAQALKTAIAQGGRAFYIDLHGQNHRDRRIELGYLHAPETLQAPDSALDAPGVAASGSLRRIAEKSKLPYSALVRGPRSLGALLEARGFACVPSPERPEPVLPYFQGGYSVRRHVAADQPVAGLQIECTLAGVRDTPENRAKFAAALVDVLREYLAEHYALRLPVP